MTPVPSAARPSAMPAPAGRTALSDGGSDGSHFRLAPAGPAMRGTGTGSTPGGPTIGSGGSAGHDADTAPNVDGSPALPFSLPLDGADAAGVGPPGAEGPAKARSPRVDAATQPWSWAMAWVSPGSTAPQTTGPVTADEGVDGAGSTLKGRFIGGPADGTVLRGDPGPAPRGGGPASGNTAPADTSPFGTRVKVGLATAATTARNADPLPPVGTVPVAAPAAPGGDATLMGRPIVTAPAEVSTPAPPQPSLPAEAQAVMRSVSDGLRSVRIAEGRTRIELSPRGLGDIEVELRREDGPRVQIVLRAESPAVLAAMRADRDGLAGLLRDSGLAVADGDLSYEGFAGHGSSHGSARDRGFERTPGSDTAFARPTDPRDDGRLAPPRGPTAVVAGTHALDILT